MMLIVEARSSYSLQILPFLVFILEEAWAVCLAVVEKQSPALMLSAGFSRSSLLFGDELSLGNTLGVCVAIAFAYGVPTAAMFVPAASGMTSPWGAAPIRAETVRRSV